MLGATTRLPHLVHGYEGAAVVSADHSGAGGGCGGGSGPQQLVPSAVLAPQQDGRAGLDGSVPAEPCVGGAL